MLHRVWTPEQRALSRRLLIELNHRSASERMKKNNPMYKPDVRKKVSTALKAIGHKPLIHGGNGTGLTKPQELLAKKLEDLGFEPACEYVVPTHTKRDTSGYPSHYKIDIAIPDRMTAIEIDGPSHLSLKIQAADKKKTGFLTGLGWNVLRFTNKAVMADLEGCVQTVLSTTSK